MAIKILGRAIEWKRRRRCSVKSSEGREEQQIDRLNDDVWTNIFSFLGEPSNDSHRGENGEGKQKRKDLIELSQAKRLHSTLSAVCRRWRSVCNSNTVTIFGRINADLNVLPVAQVVSHVQWMIKNRVSLAALAFNADRGDILLLEKLLNHCDTSQLTFVHAHINIGSGHYSKWVSEAYARTIDRYDTRITLLEMCKSLGVPYSHSPQRLRQLHNAIALNCNKLCDLEVNVEFPQAAIGTTYRKFLLATGTTHRDYFSEALFSMDSIRRLKLSVQLTFGTSSIVEWMLENLVNLQELWISCPAIRFSFRWPKRIRIASKNLRSLNALGLSKDTWISGDLPKLEKLTCIGYGGIVPQFTNEQRKNVITTNGFQQRDNNHCFFAGQAKIPNIQIPPACKVVVHEISGDCITDAPHWLHQRFRNAPIW